MRVLFKNGTVVSGKGTRRADVLVDGEKIQRVARDIHVDDAQVVDAAGMLLMPGFIDAHTHFDLDVCNTTTIDDFDSGTKSFKNRAHRNHGAPIDYCWGNIHLQGLAVNINIGGKGSQRCEGTERCQKQGNPFF